MKRTIGDWLIVLASVLDDAVVVAIILLLLWLLRIPVSLPVIVSLIIMFIALVLIMHKLVLPVLHMRKATGSEGMLGLQGRATKLLAPDGTIIVKGEYWNARSIGANIPVGKRVEIVGIEGLTLTVKNIDF